ncbi:MAG TPA: type II secretion system protein [Burkholderiaceae bacterium]
MRPRDASASLSLRACAGPASRARTRPGAQRGLVLIALLLMLVLVGIGALAASELYATQRQREREVELMFAGEQYRLAIEHFWKSTPGPRKLLPNSIEQLLTDDRFPNPVHHLRRAYRDPMNENGDWELIKVNNALVGVRSASTQAPIKRAGFPNRYKQFEKAETYTDWQFVFSPAGVAFTPVGQPGVPAPLTPPPSTPGVGAPGVPVPPALSAPGGFGSQPQQ